MQNDKQPDDNQQQAEYLPFIRMTDIFLLAVSYGKILVLVP
jgi:hypothetical protein